MKKFQVLVAAPGLEIPSELIDTDDWDKAQEVLLAEIEEMRGWAQETPEGQERTLRVRDEIDALFIQKDEYGIHKVYVWIHQETPSNVSTAAQMFGEPRFHIT